MTSFLLALTACAPTDTLSNELEDARKDLDSLTDKVDVQQEALDALAEKDTEQDAGIAGVAGAGYAQTTYVDEAVAALAAAVEQAGYATRTYVDDAISGLAAVYATPSYVDDAVATLESTAAKAADLDEVEAAVGDLEVAEVPVGTVIDWYRPSAATALPSGWALMDGSTVSDPDSPFDGVTLPDMTDKFTRGVMNQNEIAVEGGADTHEHIADITHSHTGYTSVDGDHQHVALSWLDTYHQWRSGSGGTVMVDYGSSYGGFQSNESSDDTYPVAYTDGADLDVYTSTSGDHDHDVTTYDYVGDAICEAESNVPVYVGFLKIIRIK